MTAPIRLLDLAMAPDLADAYTRLRRRHGEVVWVELEPGVGAWLVLGHRELLQLTRDEKRFSRAALHWGLFQRGVVPPDSPLGPMMFYRDNVVGADGARHRRLRAPLDAGLAALDQRGLRKAVEQVAAELIAGFAGRGRADLLAEYAVVVPMLAIAHMIGMSPAQGRALLEPMRRLFASGPEAQAGNAEFERILGDALRARRARPGDDLTSAFLAHPDLHDDAEVLQSMVVMTTAGYHTTISWIANSLALLLTDTVLARRVRGGRLDTGEALDQVLWSSPSMLHMPARYALADTELGGRPIARGDALILGLAGAGYDPRVRDLAAPPEVGNRAHLAFSAGPHACPARDPARLITTVAVDTVLDMLPDVALVISPGEIAYLPSPWSRTPAALPVAFTPARRVP